jgi:hypothetical protein
MEITIKNPGLPPFKIEHATKKAGVRWSYKAYKITDKFRPREGQLKIPKEIPVLQFAEVLIVESGKPSFHGYVEQYSIDSKRTKTLTLAGMERLLMERWTPDFFYPAGSTFAKLFADACTLNDPPGLLAIANGLIPIGRAYTVHSVANNVICLEGAGLTSRYGNRNLYFIDYKYLKELPSVHDVGGLDYVDMTHFRNQQDLYIRIDHNYSRGWMDRGGVICDGAFDTSVRLGNCDISLVLKGDLTTSALDDNIADLITNIILSHGYHLHLRDTKNALYLDIDDSEGRS